MSLISLRSGDEKSFFILFKINFQRKAKREKMSFPARFMRNLFPLNSLLRSNFFCELTKTECKLQKQFQKLLGTTENYTTAVHKKVQVAK